jgi:glycosyltransferase involved in cell wall biosynthesis
MTPQEESCRRLGLHHGRYLPCAIPYETALLVPLSREERALVRDRLGLPRNGFVVTQPARQEWTYSPEGWGSNHKGNDRFLRGFARFLHGPGKDAWLVAVDKGRDVGASMRLAHELGIADRIRWIPQQNKAGLRECLGASDLVADCFTYGFYAMSTLDAMAIGRPVLAYLDRKGLEKFGVKPPPVVSARSEDEIHDALCHLVENRQRGEEIGSASREWMIEYHGWEPVIERYLALYKELRDGRA